VYGAGAKSAAADDETEPLWFQLNEAIGKKEEETDR